MRAREFAARPRARHRDERGFTLIELLIVIVIIGVLAGIVMFAVPRFRDDANLAADLTNLSTLNTASATYAVSAGPGQGLSDLPSDTARMNRLFDRGLLVGDPSHVITATVAGAAFTWSASADQWLYSSGTTIISAGPVTKLAFTTQPSSATGTSFPSQPVVAVQDASGNTASSTVPVNLSITGGGATLTCTANPVTAVAGVATFAGCTIDRAGTYTLTASSGTLTRVSASFTMTSSTPPLTCSDQTWMATFSWSPTPNQPTTYTLYVNGIQVPATGADGWNSYVQLMSSNVPVSAFAQGSATVEVRKMVGGQEQVIGDGVVLLGPADHRTYTCH